ncbi:TetR/AcrR family transcriptional regulator [Cellulomonas hominis]
MPRAGLSRSAVVALALEVADDGGPDGFTGLTLAAVAARAGVAVPSLYKHVHGLDDLRRAVALVCVEEFTALLAATVDQVGTHPATADPAATVRALAHVTRDHARHHPARYSAVQGGSWARDPLAGEVQRAGARSVEVIAAALARTGLPPERTVDAVRTFRAVVHGFVSLELEGGFGLPDDVGASFDYALDRLSG